MTGEIPRPLSKLEYEMSEWKSRGIALDILEIEADWPFDQSTATETCTE